MAKFVIGKNTTNGVPALFKDGTVDKEKFGITIDNLVGDVDSNGGYVKPSGELEVDFSGVRTIGQKGMAHMFSSSAAVKSASFPDLEVIDEYGLDSTFADSTIESFSAPKLRQVTTECAMRDTFSGAKNLSSLSMPNLQSVDGVSAFYCIVANSGVLSVNIPNLHTATGNAVLSGAFESTRLQQLDLSNLRTVSGASALAYLCNACPSLTTLDIGNVPYLDYQQMAVYMCGNCGSLTNIDVSGLQSVSGTQVFAYTFMGCSSLETVRFSSLSVIGGAQTFNQAFRGSGIKHIYMPAITNNSFVNSSNVFYGMLYQTSGCTMHFPANVQATVQALPDYDSGFYGNATILFDLQPTVELQVSSFAGQPVRRYPKYDTNNALAWSVVSYRGDGTVDTGQKYWSMGTTNPSVNDVLYHDLEFTNPAGTILSITTL